MVVLQNTRNIDADVIGSGFPAVWNSLGMDQQQVIRKHALLMRKKKFPLKPHMVNYFGAIVNAAVIEHADAQTLTKYLSVAGKVMENYNAQKVLNFFINSRTFFQYHAFHYEKTFRLYVKDDSYTFDFIAPAPTVSWYDTARTESDLSTPDQDGDAPASEQST